MAEMEVVPVRDRKALRRFLAWPYWLYRNDPYWVAPLWMAQKQLLDTRRHPFYAHAEMECFLALGGGRILGRIAAILDRSFNDFQHEQAGFFGFFESVRDAGVAGALLAAARDWLLERGARVIRGPMNPSTNYECGLLVDGFDSSPCVMMPYNPRYYAELIEQAGLRKAKDLYAYDLTDPGVAVEKVERIADRALQANRFRIRPIRLEAFESELGIVWQIYNSAWSRNWGFSPMSRDEISFMARDMKPILVPDLVLIGEVDGRPVGFALALPDINEALKRAKGHLFPFGLLKILYYKQFIRRFRVITLGVQEEYRTAGVAAGLYATLIRRGRQLGYNRCEVSWVLDDNVLMQRSAEALGARRYKTYRVYEWN